MQRVVREVASSGVAVASSSTTSRSCRDLCDEAVFMFQGRILGRGSVADLTANPQLTELYFGHRGAAMLAIENLTASYAALSAISDISFTLAKGARVGIFGQTGPVRPRC